MATDNDATNNNANKTSSATTIKLKAVDATDVVNDGSKHAVMEVEQLFYNTHLFQSSTEFLNRESEFMEPQTIPPLNPAEPIPEQPSAKKPSQKRCVPCFVSPCLEPANANYRYPEIMICYRDPKLHRENNMMRYFCCPLTLAKKEIRGKNTANLASKKPEPKRAEPRKIEPKKIEPKKTEQRKIEPKKMEPESVVPKMALRERTEPEMTEPGRTNPEWTEPEMTEPNLYCVYGPHLTHNWHSYCNPQYQEYSQLGLNSYMPHNCFSLHSFNCPMSAQCSLNNHCMCACQLQMMNSFPGYPYDCHQNQMHQSDYYNCYNYQPNYMYPISG